MNLDEYITSKVKVLDKKTCIQLITLLNASNDISTILTLIDNIAINNYREGYHDGYDDGVVDAL